MSERGCASFKALFQPFNTVRAFKLDLHGDFRDFVSFDKSKVALFQLVY